MKLIPIAAMCAILATCPAIAQDAPTAPSAVPAADPLCDNLKAVPKAKAVMLMALRERTMEIPYSTALACETERCRLKEVGVIGQCVWVR
jgi:hypothetical protein